MALLFVVELFPLDRSRRLRGKIVEDAVDAFDLCGDAGADLMKNGVGDLLDGGGHGIAGVDGTDDGRPAFVTTVVLHANALNIGNDHKVLPNLLGKAAICCFDKPGFYVL